MIPIVPEIGCLLLKKETFSVSILEYQADSVLDESSDVESWQNCPF